MNKNPSPKTRFKKGVSGNPEGSRLHDPVKRMLKQLGVTVYGEIIKKALTGTVDDLVAITKDKTGQYSVVEVSVATALLTAMKKGDAETMEIFMSRIIGKIPEVIQLDAKTISANANMAVNPEDVKRVLEKIKAGM